MLFCDKWEQAALEAYRDADGILAVTRAAYLFTLSGNTGKLFIAPFGIPPDFETVINDMRATIAVQLEENPNGTTWAWVSDSQWESFRKMFLLRRIREVVEPFLTALIEKPKRGAGVPAKEEIMTDIDAGSTA